MGLSANQIKSIKRLHQKKYRQANNQFIIEGVKLVQELLESDWECEMLLHTPEYKGRHHKQSMLITDKELQLISGLKTPNQVLAIVKKKVFALPTSFNKLMILEDIKDPGNLGTIIRTADWFGFDAVICSPETVEVFNQKVLQSTMGSVFHLPVIYSPLPEFLSALKHKCTILVSELNGKPLHSFSMNKPYALVMGSESHGVSEEVLDMADERIKIPAYGKAESLNVAVAAGVCAYALME